MRPTNQLHPPDKLSIDNWDQLQAMSILMQANVPVVLVGPAGDTKSAISIATVQSLGYELAGEPIVGTQIDPSIDVCCSCPVTDPDTGKTELVKLPGRPFMEAVEIAERGGVPVMILEEWNLSSKLVQGAFQTIVQSRFVGDMKLPESLRFIIVMNPPDIAPGAQDVMPPFCTRCAWLGWEPREDKQEKIPGFMVPFTYWRAARGLKRMHPNGLWPIPDTKKLPKDWERDFIGQASVLVDSYLGAHLDAFRDEQDHTQVNKPSACPRTWTFLERIVAACESLVEVRQDEHGKETVIEHASYDVMQLCVSGLVGRGHAQSFMTFRKLRDLADAEEIMKNGGPLPSTDSNPDVLFLLFETCAHMVESDLTLDRWKQFMDLYALAAVAGDGDYAYNAADRVMRLIGRIPGAHKCIPEGLSALQRVNKHVQKFA